MTQRMNAQDNYRQHYLNIDAVYPSVFALKMFLGKNPRFSMNGTDFKGKKILDIGFGDGRDLILFCNLGLHVYGVEVDADVVHHTRVKFEELGLDISVQVGRNDTTGFEDNSFDYVFSAAALMYLNDENTNLHDILSHTLSILKPNGYLIGTFARSDSHITSEATWLTENKIIVKDPFYKLRAGQHYYVHQSKNAAKQDLEAAGFRDIIIAEYDVDWFGTRESMFMFVATK